MLVIETARLRLRPFTLDDVDAYFTQLHNDPEVMRYLPGGKPLSREVTIWSINGIIDHWARRGYGQWAVEWDGDMVGRAGLHTIQDTDVVEVAYALAKSAWGKGIATEAARASLDYGFRTIGIPEIVGVAFPENTASRNVMLKAGMRYEGISDLYYGAQLSLYRITREEYLSTHSS